jgi:hypothetical protein
MPSVQISNSIYTGKLIFLNTKCVINGISSSLSSINVIEGGFDVLTGTISSDIFYTTAEQLASSPTSNFVTAYNVLLFSLPDQSTIVLHNDNWEFLTPSSTPRYLRYGNVQTLLQIFASEITTCTIHTTALTTSAKGFTFTKKDEEVVSDVKQIIFTEKITSRFDVFAGSEKIDFVGYTAANLNFVALPNQPKGISWLYIGGVHHSSTTFPLINSDFDLCFSTFTTGARSCLGFSAQRNFDASTINGISNSPIKIVVLTNNNSPIDFGVSGSKKYFVEGWSSTQKPTLLIRNTNPSVGAEFQNIIIDSPDSNVVFNSFRITSCEATTRFFSLVFTVTNLHFNSETFPLFSSFAQMTVTTPFVEDDGILSISFQCDSWIIGMSGKPSYTLLRPFATNRPTITLSTTKTANFLHTFNIRRTMWIRR